MKKTILRVKHRAVMALVSLAALWCSIGDAQPEELADTTRQTRIGLLPLPILFYTPETGIAGGGAILLLHRPEMADSATRPSAYSADFIYTQMQQVIAEISSDVYLNRGMYRLVGFAHFSRYPQKFYGIGNDTPESYEEEYTSRTFRLALDGFRRIAGAVSAGPSIFFEDRSLSDLIPGGALESGTVPGSRGGKTLGIGGAIQWDTRDNIFSPSGGQRYAVSMRTTVPGSDFSFFNFSFDARHYLSITEGSTLAVQALAVLTSGTAPFYLLPELGGPNIMRGYYEGRYRDKDLLFMQTEFRFPIVWRFGGVLFAGAGDVAPVLNRFTFATIKSSYGFGLRYLFDPVEKLSLRLDFGWAKNSSGFYITANEAI